MAVILLYVTDLFSVSPGRYASLESQLGANNMGQRPWLVVFAETSKLMIVICVFLLIYCSGVSNSLGSISRL